MVVSIPPPEALRAFDIATAAFADDCEGRFEAGRGLASADADRLWRLAHRIATDLVAWTESHRGMDAARDGEFTPAACADRLVEGLFDEALTPCAARVLATALDVALSVVKAPAVPDGPI